MTHFIEGSTVTHIVAHLDHRRDEGTTVCGQDGELVERDLPVDEDELCNNCMAQSPQFPDEDDDDEL